MLEEGLPSDKAKGAPRPKKANLKERRRFGENVNDLSLQQWTIIAPEGKAGDQLLEAMEPLRRLREEEQGAAVLVHRVPPDMTAKEAGDWKSNAFWPEEASEEDVPLYALVLGDLHQVSAELQHVLATNTLVGRIHFASAGGGADVPGYAAYAEKVVRFAKEGTPDTLPDFLFFTAPDGSSATVTGKLRLTDPSLSVSRERALAGKLPVASVRELSAETVDELLAAGAGSRPSVLLSVSHGLGAPRGGWRSEDLQWRRQGAMVIDHDEILDAERLRGQAFLPGGMWFYLACFGAGTPAASAYHDWLAQLSQEGAYRGSVAAVGRSLPSPGARPFIAALPQAALANPAGPLAVIGHLDLAWTYGFSGTKKLTESRKSRILAPLEKLVTGHRAGVALGLLMREYAEINDDLMREYQLEKEVLASKRPSPVDPAEQAHRWMLRNDLRGYVLLGDPAARLPLQQNASRRDARGAKGAERVEAAAAPASSASGPRSDAPRTPEAAVTVDDPETPDVLVLRFLPSPGTPPPDAERAMSAAACDLVSAAHPLLPPSMFVHRVLRGDGGSLSWEITIDGAGLPADEGGADLPAALASEARARLAGIADLVSMEAYREISFPPPGRGFSRPDDVVAFDDGSLESWVEYAPGSGTFLAGQPLPDPLLREIEAARAAVPVEPGLKPHRKGHMYTGASDRAHVAYLREHLTARAERASAADRRKILAFLAFQSREGSTAAINTYDNQIVTWGTGWGGLGWLGKVMERTALHEPARDALGRCGVRYRGRSIYDVVDLESRAVVTGKKDALEVIRRSPALLHLLIDIARNPATRDAATGAQLVTFMEGSANITGAEAVATQALFNFIAHLRHWAPGYVMGCLEWAVPQAEGEPSPERDRRLATLVGRYFYGKASKTKWIPDWKQFQLYFTRHMKEDGLDASSEPFIRAPAPPADDPFVAAPLPTAAAPRGGAALASPLLAGQAELRSIAAGKGSLRRGARGPAVTAVQRALIALGIDVPGGADGAFGRGLESAVVAFQKAHGLAADGVVGRGTLRALDAAGSPR